MSSHIISSKSESTDWKRLRGRVGRSKEKYSIGMWMKVETIIACHKYSSWITLPHRCPAPAPGLHDCGIYFSHCNVHRGYYVSLPGRNLHKPESNLPPIPFPFIERAHPSAFLPAWLWWAGPPARPCQMWVSNKSELCWPTEIWGLYVFTV